MNQPPAPQWLLTSHLPNHSPQHSLTNTLASYLFYIRASSQKLGWPYRLALPSSIEGPTEL